MSADENKIITTRGRAEVGDIVFLPVRVSKTWLDRTVIDVEYMGQWSANGTVFSDIVHLPVFVEEAWKVVKPTSV